MHKLLERQLIKRYGALAKVPKEALKFCEEVVERIYTEQDQDRRLVERSLEISSAELTGKNDELREQGRQLRQTLDEMVLAREKIKELDILKNKFINIVSHQFRTPLSAIRWSLEALLAGEVGKLAQAQKEFVRIAHDADNEVIRRIGDLLVAMDIEEGRALVVKDEISLESLWSSILPFWRRQCEVKQLACTYVPPDRPFPSIVGDADKVCNIMQKLTENAMIYTPEKGAVNVQITPEEGKRLRFTIKDSGIGIPPAEQSFVFTRFFRATNAAAMKTDASGLGLYIAKHFVRQHGGDIGFNSDLGSGSTFWFELPMESGA